MDEIPDNSIQLAVTSPPYNCEKEYEDLMTHEEYKEFTLAWMREVYRVLVNGGRLCVVIGATGRKPFADLPSYLSVWGVDEVHFLNRGRIIWYKVGRSGDSTAWGSWLSASNPFVRDTTEDILVLMKADPILADKILDLTESIIVFSKEQYKLDSDYLKTYKIPKKPFLENTINIWAEKPETRIRWHPAPYPVVIARRLITQYSFPFNTILDPFMGTGSTAIAALQQREKRYYIGYDKKKEYVEQAENRIKKFNNHHLDEYLGTQANKEPTNLMNFINQ